MSRPSGNSFFVSRGFRAIADLPLALRFALLFVAVLHATALSWGMPASDSWDNDGVAPRDILPGLAATFTPGDYYTYPPLHLGILGLLTSPITIVAVLKAGSLSVPVVIREIISPSYMTAFTMTARIVSVLMSLGIVLALAKIAEEITPEPRRLRAAIATILIAGIGRTFTYYSHMSNLDVPYLFWTSLAALGIVRAVARREPRRLRRALVFVALSVATKDQAYAVFLLGGPLAIAAWFVLDEWARTNVRAVLKDAIVGSLFALIVLLVVDGALFNPSGFRARVAFLTGSASQDYATYPRGPSGWLGVVADLGRELRHHYPYPIAIFYVIGLVVALRSVRGRTRAAALVPLWLALSFSIAFNMAARRVEERFTLPQVLFLAVYGGIGLERSWNFLAASKLRFVLRAPVLAVLGWTLFECVGLDVNLLLEPRYRTEAFLRRVVGPSDTVEVHGLNVYLPRFPPGIHVTRVGRGPTARRSPIPGLEEVEAPLDAIETRKPRYVVVSECFVWRYLTGDFVSGDRVTPTAVARALADPDATFFRDLFGGKLHYRIVDEQRFHNSVFPETRLHASVSCPMFVFEREPQL